MNYLIIGGNSSIAQNLIAELSGSDNQVYVISREPLERSTSGVHSIELDILNEEIPAEFIPESLNGFAYFPGNINLKPFRALKEKDFKEALDIHVMGAVRSIQYAEKALKKSPGSSILLYSSVAVQTGMPFHAAIGIAKGAIEGLVRSLAAEFAPTIRVNGIALSLTNTKMAERLLSTDQKVEASKERHPLKEVGDPKNIAEISAFLLGDKAKWITGQILQADGGIGSLKTN